MLTRGVGGSGEATGGPSGQLLITSGQPRCRAAARRICLVAPRRNARSCRSRAGTDAAREESTPHEVAAAGSTAPARFPARYVSPQPGPRDDFTVSLNADASAFSAPGAGAGDGPASNP